MERCPENLVLCVTSMKDFRTLLGVLDDDEFKINKSVIILLKMIHITCGWHYPPRLRDDKEVFARIFASDYMVRQRRVGRVFEVQEAVVDSEPEPTHEAVEEEKVAIMGDNIIVSCALVAVMSDGSAVCVILSFSNTFICLFNIIYRQQLQHP